MRTPLAPLGKSRGGEEVRTPPGPRTIRRGGKVDLVPAPGLQGTAGRRTNIIISCVRDAAGGGCLGVVSDDEVWTCLVMYTLHY